MYLPELPALKNSRRQMRVFGGLNETFGCTEAEYGAERNFSSRDFPALSTRCPAAGCGTRKAPTGCTI